MADDAVVAAVERLGDREPAVRGVAGAPGRRAENVVLGEPGDEVGRLSAPAPVKARRAPVGADPEEKEAFLVVVDRACAALTEVRRFLDVARRRVAAPTSRRGVSDIAVSSVRDGWVVRR